MKPAEHRLQEALFDLRVKVLLALSQRAGRMIDIDEIRARAIHESDEAILRPVERRAQTLHRRILAVWHRWWR